MIDFTTHLPLTLNESRDAIDSSIDSAMQRLSQVDDGGQRTLGEWCSNILRQAYQGEINAYQPNGHCIYR